MTTLLLYALVLAQGLILAGLWRVPRTDDLGTKEGRYAALLTAAALIAPVRGWAALQWLGY